MSHIDMVTTCSPRVEVGDVGRCVPKSGCQLEWYSISPWVRSLVWGVRIEAPKSYWWRRCWANVGSSAAEAMLVMVWCRCWVTLEMTLPRWHWSWRDVVAESCWRCYRYWIDVDRDVMSLPELGSLDICSDLDERPLDQSAGQTQQGHASAVGIFSMVSALTCLHQKPKRPLIMSAINWLG
jgi:hypothetical protein